MEVSTRVTACSPWRHPARRKQPCLFVYNNDHDDDHSDDNEEDDAMDHDDDDEH